MKFKKKNRLILVREPNGKPSRQTEEREFAPTRVRRLLDASMCGMADREWGTSIGRLYVRRKITAPMYAAGRRWSEYVVKYHAAINAPPPDPRCVQIGDRESRAEPPDPESEEGKKRTRKEVDAVTEFLAAHAVLVSAGKLSEHEVRAACEQDQEPNGHEGLIALERGLLWLADYWGLTNQRKQNV